MAISTYANYTGTVLSLSNGANDYLVHAEDGNGLTI